MITERTPHQSEDDDGTDKPAPYDGPAFRPVPSVERVAPEKPPRLPDGVVLFDRKFLEKPLESKAETDEEESDTEEEARTPQAVSRSTPLKAVPPLTGLQPPKTEILQPAAAATRSEGAIEQSPYNYGTDQSVHRPEDALYTAPVESSPQAEMSELPRQRETMQPALDAGEYASITSLDEFRAQKRRLAAEAAYPNAAQNEFAAPYPNEVSESVPSGPQQHPASVSQLFPNASSMPSSSEGQPSYTPTSGAYGEAPPPPSPESAPNIGGNLPPMPPIGHQAETGPPSYNTTSYNQLPPYGGSGGGSHNAMPAAAPNLLKKPNVWPYVAVLGENFARKRADRKLKKELSSRIDAQDKALQEGQSEQRRFQAQQEQLAAEQRRQMTAAERPRPGEWGVPTAPVTAGGPPASGERTPASKTETRQPIPPPSAEQQIDGSLEQPAELSPHQRVEHSAWHNIVVNERGQEVAGAIQYGEGFRRERQQEVVRDRTGDTMAAGAGAASAAAAGGGQSASGGQSYYGSASPYTQHSLPSGMTAQSLPQGMPAYADPQHRLPPAQVPSKRSTSALPGPLFWLMIALIMAAFFAAALI